MAASNANIILECLARARLSFLNTACVSAYKGSVLILHGTKDKIVSLWCSDRYKENYGEKAELRIIEGENHTITRRRKEVVRAVVEFFLPLRHHENLS